MPVEVTEQYVRIRQKAPGQYLRMRTIVISAAKGIKAIIGFKKGGGSEVQAYLFDKKKWTVATARKWIAEHKGDSLSDIILFTKLEDQANARDRILADEALIKKLEDQAVGKGFVKHTDSIGMKGDALEGDAWTETNEGITFRDVVFTKEMVQQYSNGKHYKPAEELKKALDSLRGKPVTAYVHPPEKVVTSLAQQVGYIVFDSVKWDKKGKRPYGDVFIKKELKNKQLIEDTKKGRLKDVSVGFRCSEVKQPGTFMGEHYDIRQENFFFDHLALVMQGRAGSEDGVGLNAF